MKRAFPRRQEPGSLMPFDRASPTTSEPLLPSRDHRPPPPPPPPPPPSALSLSSAAAVAPTSAPTTVMSPRADKPHSVPLLRCSSKKDEDEAMLGAEHEAEDCASTNPRKKKRRIMKNSDKKYECPQPECGKSYSRAEHLYRHQLNHTPKQIYHCDFPACDRHFVRADLCARHRERHTAKGSHLQRKDAWMHTQEPLSPPVPQLHSINLAGSDSGNTFAICQSPVDSHHAANHSVTQSDPCMPPPPPPPPPQSALSYTSSEHYAKEQSVSDLSPTQPRSVVTVDAQLGTPYENPAYSSSGPVVPSPSTENLVRRYGIDGQLNTSTELQNGYSQHQHLPMHTPHLSSPATSNLIYHQQQQHLHQRQQHHQQQSQPPQPPPQPLVSQQQQHQRARQQQNQCAPQQHQHGQHQQTQFPSAPDGLDIRSHPNGNYTTLPVLPTYSLSAAAYNTAGSVRPSNAMSPPIINPLDQFQIAPARAGSVNDFNALGNCAHAYAMPVFGVEGFNRSPLSALDDVLFNQLMASADLDLNNPPSPPSVEMMYHSHVPNMPVPKPEPEATPILEPAVYSKVVENTSCTTMGMDLTMRESTMSERKQLRIISLVNSFEDVEDSAGRRTKAEILAGDNSEANHVLSITMLKTYLASFWIHIHQQLPIMHRPTFNAETCPDLLLLTMCCLGACCLERIHPPDLIKASAELAFFSAYHIRWEMFKDREFRPTAKLWTFQTMLFLELFEKMYSTRTLYERAHIHHATTLTVMRRGSSLIGRSTVESPAGKYDPTRTPPGPDGSINTSGQNTPDAWWNRWITAEATRRVAFAAFIIDSTHATLFGHSAVMSPHDLRLPLPCDEALWSATSSTEVRRVEASLAASGFKPTSFLEGLKKILNGQKVRTNVFGRVILMSGLLNVSWHMNQRDLQVSSIGASNTLGNPTRWRSPLSRAFDFWRRDFDESVNKTNYASVTKLENKSRCHSDHRDNVFESRSCLHSLAHMAMHVDIVDCEVFAGSKRALGRIVIESDRAAVQKRMRELWAPSARARDAVFYALRFLCEVLIPDEDLSGGATSTRPRTAPPTFQYSARDDCLLNRPWTLYLSVMVVWAYGYALDGALKSTQFTLTTRELRIQDMHSFLVRVGGVASPEDLENTVNRNGCLGLLLLLRDCFRQPRWELLHDASDMLQLCCELLLPGNMDVKAALVSAPHD